MVKVIGLQLGQMKKFINAATGTHGVYVSHGLRHSFSMNCRNSNCRDDDKATLGGWASYGGATAVSKGYGSDAMFDQSNIERLYKVSADIHRNLM
jgi:integrase